MNYTIVEEIGVGGSGTVYLATTPDGRMLAVKRLHAGSANRNHNLREATALAELSSRNVVAFYGVCDTDNGGLDLLMEWVDGCDLTTLLRQYERIPLSAAIFIAAEMLRGLHAIHSHGWLHRDVTPNNVLIGKTGDVKLSDVGQARFIGSKRTTAMMRGTPLYMPPERHRTLAELDASSDLFAVGVVLYELITRAMPFDSIEQILAHKRPITPLTAFNSVIPESINRIVMRMLQRRPDDRYQSASAILDAFAEALGPRFDELERAELVDHACSRSHMSNPSLAKPTKRRIRFLAVVTGFVASMVLGAAGASYLSESRQSHRTHKEPIPLDGGGRAICIPADEPASPVSLTPERV